VKITPEIKNCLECKLAKVKQKPFNHTLARAKQKPFNQERTRTVRPLQIIESDMMGPHPSIN